MLEVRQKYFHLTLNVLLHYHMIVENNNTTDYTAFTINCCHASYNSSKTLFISPIAPDIMRCFGVQKPDIIAVHRLTEVFLRGHVS